MQNIKGVLVSEGIAIGHISVLDDEIEVKPTKTKNPKREVALYEKATNKALEDIDALIIKATDKEAKEILEMHKLMLLDLDYKETVLNGINTEKYNAAYAVKEAGDILARMFFHMEDEYFRARSQDVLDISSQLIKIILDKDTNVINEEKIFVGTDIMPSQLMEIDPKFILGFAFSEGSVNSHSGIVARNMSIPMICQTKQDLSKLDGKLAIIDGKSGLLIVDPTEDALVEYQAKIKANLEYKEMLETLKGKEDITTDGKKLVVKANIGSPKDLQKVLDNDASGVGLFRSEFLFLDAKDYPTEEEQFIAYKTVALGLEGKPCVIRTLDIGADKKVDYFNLPEEKNPALGYRAVRICLDRTDIFKTQLRAILRASHYGNLSIMIPMIISLEEVLRCKEIINEVKADLKKEGIPYKDCELGIMIETPASVIIADILAKEVDFFSIGTNDLTQYTLAVDRENEHLSYDKHHPAILRMLKMICDSAHKHNTRVCICGELGADLDLTEYYLAIGIDEVSVSPPSVLKVRNKLRNTCFNDIKDKFKFNED